MLRLFAVKNYNNIGEKTSYDVQSIVGLTPEDKVLTEKLEDPAMPNSATYGPNGGGDLNVLESMHALYGVMLRPMGIGEEGREIVIKPFSEETRDEPSEFEMTFRTEQAQYKYTIHLKEEEILYECFEFVKLGTEERITLFERGDEIALGGAFADFKVDGDLSKTLPLFSYIGLNYKDHEIVQDVMNWMTHGIHFLQHGNPIIRVIEYIENNGRITVEKCMELSDKPVEIAEKYLSRLSDIGILRPDGDEYVKAH